MEIIDLLKNANELLVKEFNNENHHYEELPNDGEVSEDQHLRECCQMAIGYEILKEDPEWDIQQLYNIRLLVSETGIKIRYSTTDKGIKKIISRANTCLLKMRKL